FSFFATTETILLLGAKAVYVDIEPDTYNLNANLLEQAITKNTKAILPVSMYGQCCDMDAINAIADKHGITVIEDAAQSFGARYKQRKSCALSTIACTSFFPSKPLGAYGDAGACFTNDSVLAEKMRRVMNHGQEQRYKHVMLGINGRCDTLQAAILLCKLKILDDELAKRQQVANWYAQALPSSLHPPVISEHNNSAFAQYTIQLADRDVCQQALKENGIPSMVHYPIGLHQQPIAQRLQTEAQSFPVTEVVAARVLSLPFYPYMQQQQVLEVVQGLQQVTSLELVSE
nr:DegT/DnrJ/EryC1/StrS family aminotransferase [Gammaproteobacteria bacterium]